MKKQISIHLDKELIKALEKRAKKNYMTLRELINDILIRSMANYGKTGRSYGEPKVEKMVRIFSRKKRGRKPKR